MITGYQAQTVAYFFDTGERVCVRCYTSPDEEHADAYEEQHAVSRYEVDESNDGDGVYCAHCDAEISEPFEAED